MNIRSKPSKLLKGATGEWEVVIGMEIHAQVTSQAKLFSGASTEFGGEPNSHVSLVDAAMPGMLPVVNEAGHRFNADIAAGATVDFDHHLLGPNFREPRRGDARDRVSAPPGANGTINRTVPRA